MKSNTFETRIEPFMKLIEEVCNEENIKFLAHFDLDNGEEYRDGDLVLPITDIYTQIQHWEAKGVKLIPEVEETKEQILKDTLANAKLKFERELDSLVLTIQSGRYAIKVDVTDEILPLVKELDEKEGFMKIKEIDLKRLKGYVKLLEEGKLDLDAIKRLNENK